VISTKPGIGARSGDVMMILGPDASEKFNSDGSNRLFEALSDSAGRKTFTGIFRGVKVPDISMIRKVYKERTNISTHQIKQPVKHLPSQSNHRRCLLPISTPQLPNGS
jgi:hypothetical protein